MVFVALVDFDFGRPDGYLETLSHGELSRGADRELHASAHATAEHALQNFRDRCSVDAGQQSEWIDTDLNVVADCELVVQRTCHLHVVAVSGDGVHTEETGRRGIPDGIALVEISAAATAAGNQF